MAENELSVKYSIINQISKPLEAIKGSILETATAFATGQLAVDALKFGFGQLKGFVDDSIKSFDEAATVAIKLQTAIGGNADALLKYASERQSVTRFDDEAIANAMATLATYGLTEKQIKKLIPSIQDMAQATGKDLSSAADLAGRSITTNTNAMKRMGIEIDDSTSKTDRLGQVVDQLTVKFGGQAEAAARVGAGSLVQLKNNFGDLQENVGKATTEFPPFQWAVELANKALLLAVDCTSDAADEYKQLASDVDAEDGPTNALMDLNAELLKMAVIAPVASDSIMDISVTTKLFKSSPEDVKALVDSFKTVSAVADQTRVDMEKQVRAITAAIAKGKKSSKKEDDTIDQPAKKEKDTTASKYKDDVAELKAYFANINRIKKEQAAKDEAFNKAKYAKDKVFADQMTGLFTELGSGMAAGLASGHDELKNAMKNMLVTSLSFVEKYIITQEAAQMAAGWWNPAVWAQIAATAALFEGAKAGVQSFQTMPGQFKTVPGGPNQSVLVMAHGGEEIGRPNNTVNNTNNNGVTFIIQKGAYINNADRAALARTLDEMAKDGHFQRAYNFKNAIK